MKSSALPIAFIVALQGCASAQHEPTLAASEPTHSSDPRICRVAAGRDCMPEVMNEISPAAIHLAKVGVTREAAIHGAEVATRADAPLIEGRPLTSVVVTQCNLVVAVYMTMPDGKLLRFDKGADVPAEDLVAVAYTASSSERVEVACEGVGVSGYETHKPI